MAAAAEFPAPKVVDLRRLRGSDLEGVLAEEVQFWREQFHWDFRPAADLVKRFVSTQSLAGYALVHGTTVVGYLYTVAEDRKIVIGGLFIQRAFRTIEAEGLLIEAAISEALRSPTLKRVESQLMTLMSPMDRPFPYSQWLSIRERFYMEAPLPRLVNWPLPERNTPTSFERWMPDAQPEAASLIARAYHGHVDSDINEQYRTPAGARQFLNNIVQYPGCGAFFQPASFVARDRRTGVLCGISLSSLVALDSGHITQICVDPSVQHQRVGRELLRRSMIALEEADCRRVSLTVTHNNADAIRLYEKFGFQTTHRFAACVWEAGSR